MQNYNRDDESTRFKESSEAYFKRFQRNPGFSSVRPLTPRLSC